MLKKNTDSKPLALIVDDEKSICSTLAGVLSDEGWNCVLASSGNEGIKMFQKHLVGIVFLDVWMDHMDGIQALQKMKETKPEVPIVIMSGHGTVETAVKATKLGAMDFLEKPLSLEKILPLLDLVAEMREKGSKDSFIEGNYQLIGESDHIASLHRQIKVIAPRNSWVLITGENGTGKEVLARNIHLHSARADYSFVAVNCAAIPEELIESELFGYVKGAFTNAIAMKRGKFELANKGTLFLDEIADMSLKTQAKILRILQEQTFERLGSNDEVSVDVRVIAATNKDLKQEIEKGTFREDLYYRLNVIPIQMLPLRERSSDIPVLVDYFLTKMSIELNEEKKIFSKSALNFLMKLEWPGNIRELKNIVERLSILTIGKIISDEEILKFLPDIEKEPTPLAKKESTLREARSQFEKAFIESKLEENDWNISKTAEVIGVERSNLHRKLKYYDIDTKRLKI